jgi:hydroxymethylbilane synthase
MRNRDGPLRLATRPSDLARWQAATVRDALDDRGIAAELVPVESDGDRIRDALLHRLGTTGAFVRALDERVLGGDVDGAVHSMKDMPTEPTDLAVAAIPERGAAGDALVTPDGASLADLPEGAVVGTSSLRRRAQLLAERPDLDVRPLRGNVDTRVEKLLAPHLQREHERRLEAAEADDDAFGRSVDAWFDDLAAVERRALERTPETAFDAIVLARAGLERLGLDRTVAHHPIDERTVVPAPGQGAIAVTMRDTDRAERVRDAVDHPRTRVETTVERTVLAELGGGCVAPIGVHATLAGGRVHTVARVSSADGDRVVGTARDLPVETHREAARDLAADLAADGATDLIAAARERADDPPTRADAAATEGATE